MLFALLRLQGVLPLNPAGVPSMPSHIAFNTAVSFVTNTNWQAYSGEASASYLSQMVGLTWQNFVSAAAGIAVAVAFVRGLTRGVCRGIGNFWVDLTRSWLYVLLPGAVVIALLLASQGVVQNLNAYSQATTLEGAQQVIAQGPVASQEAIKMLGTNGGGFFNANSAHPYENPTPLTNFLEMLSILVIPSGLDLHVRQAGRQHAAGMGAAERDGRAVRALDDGDLRAPSGPATPTSSRAGADTTASAGSAGGNMEGKEVRFGIASSSIFANATTAASCGAVNAIALQPDSAGGRDGAAQHRAGRGRSSAAWARGCTAC